VHNILTLFGDDYALARMNPEYLVNQHTLLITFIDLLICRRASTPLFLGFWWETRMTS
jgi:hypothetical protein